MDEEDRKNYFDIEVKPQMKEFKRRIEAEKLYIEHYKKVAKGGFHFHNNLRHKRTGLEKTDWKLDKGWSWQTNEFIDGTVHVRDKSA